MHDAARVGVRQGVGHLLEQVRDVLERRARFAHDARREALTLHQRHREADQSAFLVHRIDGHDVRMIKPRCRLCFAHEALTHVAAERELGRQHFERHRSL